MNIWVMALVIVLASMPYGGWKTWMKTRRAQ